MSGSHQLYRYDLLREETWHGYGAITTAIGSAITAVRLLSSIPTIMTTYAKSARSLINNKTSPQRQITESGRLPGILRK